MDGVMFMHSARLPKLREKLASDVGAVKRITSAFSFVGDDEFFASNIRASSELEPFGCLGDLGWYCIRLALWVMNAQMPRTVTGRVLQSAGKKSGVPTEFSGELFFGKGVSSSFYCSFVTETEQWAHISGSKGLVTLSDFVLPFFGSDVAFNFGKPVFNLRGCHFRMEPHVSRASVDEYSNNDPTSQETKLFRNFADLVLSGKRDNYWPEIALKTQRVMEACLASSKRHSVEVSL
jgi:predicted dehydrogenase